MEHLVDFVGARAFWIGLVQIIGIDLILSGDNALVIALACRNLQPGQRKWGVILGTAAAVILRILFATIIVYVLDAPLLKLLGAALLLWIAIKLMIPEEGAGGHGGGGGGGPSLWSAVRTVIIADAVMSLDNVMAVAAAAHSAATGAGEAGLSPEAIEAGSVLLLALGIAISIPLMVIGSSMMIWLLDRFPWLMILGGALLGWIAGGLAVHDPVSAPWLSANMPWLVSAAPFLGAGLVVVVSVWLMRRPRPAKRAEALDMGDHGAGRDA